MSLKSFHIVFVTISTLLCLFLALWGFGWVEQTEPLVRLLGITGILGAVIMPIYGVIFYRKIRRDHL